MSKQRENMTSHYPLYCETSPYVGRVSVGEEDRVDFIYQFVEDSFISDINNIYNMDIINTLDYICGTPTTFPNGPDFSRTFVMVCVSPGIILCYCPIEGDRNLTLDYKILSYLTLVDFLTQRNYGRDISISPWQDEQLAEPIPEYREQIINNFLDLEFHEAVYPIRVSIYEIYNPGNIIGIWAAENPDDFDNEWFLLWGGSPQIVLPTSRLFSPPLQSCNFKTNKLRLEFKRSVWYYETRIDAVMFIGASKLILPKDPNKSLTDLLRGINYVIHPPHHDIHNLTANYENAYFDIDHLQKNFPEHCIICESDTEESFLESNFEHKEKSREVIPDYVWEILYISEILLKIIRNPSYSKQMKLSSHESKKLSHCSLSDVFPDEVILEILKNLDLKMLCRMSQVNKRFNYLTRDPRLYTRLNMRYIGCHMYIRNIFCYFTPRCKYLQQLDLALSDFEGSDFVKFLNDCGSHLTHLRLSNCLSVDEFALFKISEICKNLKELDIRRCRNIEKEGFLYLENIEGLEHLNLSNTRIDAQSLCKILQKNERMRELNLGDLDINLDAVAIQLRNSCRYLEILNLSNMRTCVTSQFIDALADCKNLRNVDLPFNNFNIPNDSLSRLLSSCQGLEEIYLCGTVITDHNLKLLTRCKNLKKLGFSYVKLVTPEKCSIIFEQCSKFRMLSLIQCDISPCLIDEWLKRYPQMSVDIVLKDMMSHIYIYIYQIGNFTLPVNN